MNRCVSALQNDCKLVKRLIKNRCSYQTGLYSAQGIEEHQKSHCLVTVGCLREMGREGLHCKQAKNRVGRAHCFWHQPTSLLQLSQLGRSPTLLKTKLNIPTQSLPNGCTRAGKGKGENTEVGGQLTRWAHGHLPAALSAGCICK